MSSESDLLQLGAVHYEGFAFTGECESASEDSESTDNFGEVTCTDCLEIINRDMTPGLRRLPNEAVEDEEPLEEAGESCDDPQWPHVAQWQVRQLCEDLGLIGDYLLDSIP